MCSINGKNRVMVDLMRPKRGLGGPSAEVTSKHEKKQGESNGESLCVFIVTCLANKQGWLVYSPWQEQCFLLLCIWGSNADGWMEKWMDRWMDGWGLSADGERTKHQCDRMRKADLCARWAWTWTSPFRAQNPRGEDLVVDSLYRGSSFVEKVKMKGCWNRKATVSVICCHPKETWFSKSCTAWVPPAAQKSAWAFPKSCPLFLEPQCPICCPSLPGPPAYRSGFSWFMKSHGGYPDSMALVTGALALV